MFLLMKVFVFLVYMDRLEVVTMLVFVEDYHHIAFGMDTYFDTVCLIILIFIILYCVMPMMVLAQTMSRYSI